MSASYSDVDALRRLGAAITAGTDVEAQLDELITRVPEDGEPRRTMFDLVASLWRRDRAGDVTADARRRVADGLDTFAATIGPAAEAVDGSELSAIAERSSEWGTELWDGRLGVDFAYNEVRNALVELCRHRARLLTGRHLN